MHLTVETATEAFDAWYTALCDMAHQGFKIPSRDGNVVGEILNAVTVIKDPTRGICNSKLRNMPIRYALGELIWYLSGSNAVKDITQYSKVWERLSDDGETVNSAYGHRIHHRFGFDQWQHVKELLRADPYSRRAIIHIKDASPYPSKDVPCTLSLQFQIREGKLYLTTVMRSNDIWTGFPYDVFAFTAMQVKMAMELGVDLGDYTHVAGSLHLYERNTDGFVEKAAPEGTP